MSPVEQYELKDSHTGAEMKPEQEGLWVWAEDHQAALEAERQRVLDEVEEALTKAADDFDDRANRCYHPLIGDGMRREAKTFRALNEVALQSLTQEDEEEPCERCGGRGRLSTNGGLNWKLCPACTETPSEPEYRVVGEKGQRGSVAQFETGVAASLVWADARKSVWEQKGYRNVRIQARNAPSDEWIETPSEEE